MSLMTQEPVSESAPAEQEPIVPQSPAASDEGSTNLTANALAAKLAQAARARRAASATATPATPSTKTQPTGGTEGDAPASEDPAESESAHATSVPDDGTGAETPEESAEAVEADADTTEEARDTDSKEVPKGIRALQKRVDKLTAEKRQLEERLKGLTQQAPQETTTPGPVEVPEVIQKLDEKIANFEAHLAWFDEHPEGGTYTDERGVAVATVAEDQVKALRRQTERALAEMRGQRAAKLERITEEREAQRRQLDAEAVQQFPWLTNPETPQFVAAQRILETLPQRAVATLNEIPGARRLLAYAVEGQLAVEAAAKAAKAGLKPGASARPVPPKAFAPAATAAPKSSPQESLKRQLAEAEAAYANSGRGTDFSRVLKLKDQLRRLG